MRSFPVFLIITILAVQLASHASEAQEHWHLQNPVPTTGFYYIWGISSPSDSTLCVLGGSTYNNVLFKTTDWGGTWSSYTLPAYSSYFDQEGLCFSDPLHGWAVGYGGYIAATTDGGVTWKKQQSGTAEWLYDVKFVSSQRGWAVGGSLTAKTGTIIATTDGGKNWVAQVAPIQDFFRHASFINQDTGWTVGYESGTVLKTTNGGAVWAPVATLSPEAFSITFLDGQNGWVSGYPGTVWHTSTGGLAWEPQQNPYSGTTTSLYDITFASPELGWAVGYNTSMRTTNGGTTWELFPLSDSYSYTYLYTASVARKNSANPVALMGGYGSSINSVAILQSAEKNDDSWKNLQREASGYMYTAFRSIGLCDSLHGYAVGLTSNTGLPIVRTTDGGVTWKREDVDPAVKLYDVAVVSPSEAWAVGDQGVILRRLDSSGAPTWQPQWNLDTAKDFTAICFYGVSFLDSLRGFVVGDSTSILRTTNGGVTWRLRPRQVDESFGGYQLRSIAFAGENVGWAVGGRGDTSIIFRSTDGGASWQNYPTGFEGAGGYFSSVSFTDPAHGWIAGNTFDNTPVILSTSNGGATWTMPQTDLPFSGKLMSIRFIDSLNGWVCGSNNILSVTTDGGASWTAGAHDAIYFSSFTKLFFVGSQGWMCGAESVIMNRKNALPVGVREEQGSRLRFTLDQNFPNPFSNTTTIAIRDNFRTGPTYTVTLRDMMGRTLFSRSYSSSKTFVHLDASSLGSGVYVYEVCSGARCEGKIMTVLK